MAMQGRAWRGEVAWMARARMPLPVPLSPSRRIVAGVAAALITTVAGLLVAIPSMFGYNWLVHTLRVLTVELDNFAQELVSRMEIEYLNDNEQLELNS